MIESFTPSDRKAVNGRRFTSVRLLTLRTVTCMQVGDRVRITGGRYKRRTGTVVRLMPVYALVKHDSSGNELRSMRSNCELLAGTDAVARRSGEESADNVRALVEVAAAIVSECEDDVVKELVVLFALLANRTTS